MATTAKKMTTQERKEREAKASTLTADGLKLAFYCPVCERNVKLAFESYYVSSSESECECCGSHGHKEISFSCPKCDQYYNITLDSW